jgi:hypothetical protein
MNQLLKQLLVAVSVVGVEKLVNYIVDKRRKSA